MDKALRWCHVERLKKGLGLFAALDQSGGSTPSTLANYGVQPDAYANEEEMFALAQQMRVRIVTAPPFTGSKILGTILFEKTMESRVRGRSMPSYLLEKGIFTFLKIDKGLADETGGVQLMRPIPDLASLLNRCLQAGVVGTKTRSLILRPEATGIARIVEQQFQLAREIDAMGLIAIIEPEISIKLSDKERMYAEQLLKRTLAEYLAALPGEVKVILKLTLPVEANLYEPFTRHPCVVRVLALSGGFTRCEACCRLRKNRGMIASFSRALLEGLKLQMHAVRFNEALTSAIDEIFWASVAKCGEPSR